MSLNLKKKIENVKCELLNLFEKCNEISNFIYLKKLRMLKQADATYIFFHRLSSDF